MAIRDITAPLEIGTLVRIRNSGYGVGTVIEYRGPLGPGGTRVYGIRIGQEPAESYIEVLEEQLEVLPAGQHTL